MEIVDYLSKVIGISDMELMYFTESDYKKMGNMGTAEQIISYIKTNKPQIATMWNIYSLKQLDIISEYYSGYSLNELSNLWRYYSSQYGISWVIDVNNINLNRLEKCAKELDMIGSII